MTLFHALPSLPCFNFFKCHAVYRVSVVWGTLSLHPSHFHQTIIIFFRYIERCNGLKQNDMAAGPWIYGSSCPLTLSKHCFTKQTHVKLLGTSFLPSSGDLWHDLDKYALQKWNYACSVLQDVLSQCVTTELNRALLKAV